jgi:hypothetical protein
MGECIDGDWYPGMKRPEIKRPPPPPPPPIRVLIEVPDLPDDELVMAKAYRCFRVHHGEDWADFWVPKELDDEEMKLCRAVGGRFPTGTLAWLRWIDGRETRGGFHPENGKEFEWDEGGEERYRQVRSATESLAAQEQMQEMRRLRARRIRPLSETDTLLRPERQERRVQIQKSDTRERITVGIKGAIEMPSSKLEKIASTGRIRKCCRTRDTDSVTVWIPKYATPNMERNWWLVKDGERVPEDFWPRSDDQLQIEEERLVEKKREAEAEEAEPKLPGETEPAPVEERCDPVETERRFIRVEEATDEELEARGCKRMTVWKGSRRLGIWVPEESAEVGSGEVEETIWGALDTTEEEEDANWWIMRRGGAPVDRKHRIEHGDEFDFYTGTEEEAEEHARWRDEELERLEKEKGHEPERPEPETPPDQSTKEEHAGTAEVPAEKAENPQPNPEVAPEPEKKKVDPEGRKPPLERKPERKAQKIPSLEVRLEENGRKWTQEICMFATIESLRLAVAQERSSQPKNLTLKQGGNILRLNSMVSQWTGAPIQVEEWISPKRRRISVEYRSKRYAIECEQNVWQALAAEGIRGALQIKSEEGRELRDEDIKDGDHIWVSAIPDTLKEITLEWEGQRHVFQYKNTNALWGNIRNRLSEQRRLEITDFENSPVKDDDIASGSTYRLRAVERKKSGTTEGSRERGGSGQRTQRAPTQAKHAMGMA